METKKNSETLVFSSKLTWLNPRQDLAYLFAVKVSEFTFDRNIKQRIHKQINAGSKWKKLIKSYPDMSEYGRYRM
jgi:hypothetical protein